ncbi:hypothetical protein SAY87_019223 [Trapa incisa]|uniref:Glycosyl transferase 64 domain-containing protein n=1 Tax=Trapa incisa TaxID=236973 RepID=A0AAN7Q1F8_9MYRT|nr:hypothetical protein SAY87_019223 [Trapa incisa]
MSPMAMILCLFIIFSPLQRSFSHNDPCDDPEILRNPQDLRSDQITVMINGYSEHRIPLLRSIAAAYSGCPVVSAVLVLWGNPSTPRHVIRRLSRDLTSASIGPASISVIPQSSTSLNARFLPRRAIRTRAVLVCDDDVEVDLRSVDFAFKIWASNPERLIGLFARSHDIDLSGKEWIYTVHPDRYSIVLTKFMILSTKFLFKYSCGGGGEPIAKMRRVVDEMRNCEDILMNFVVADETNAGPILVGAERARDYGDSRNEGEREEEVREVGLSRRRGEHRKRRGECMMEFHRILGRMPLRYSYGKVVNSVGEQGLCEKGGKLVFCDESVGE